MRVFGYTRVSFPTIDLATAIFPRWVETRSRVRTHKVVGMMFGLTPEEINLSLELEQARALGEIADNVVPIKRGVT